MEADEINVHVSANPPPAMFDSSDVTKRITLDHMSISEVIGCIEQVCSSKNLLQPRASKPCISEFGHFSRKIH